MREATRRYRCFLSYRHADNQETGRQWATWLHQSIETYAVPPDLVGKQTASGWVIPERIFPVFRDEVELPADASLQAPIQRALENSDFLVVLCSPRAVQSKYVAEEILYFKQLGKSDRVLAAILAGEPNADTDGAKTGLECFPEPLRFEIGADGKFGKPSEPIAADFRLANGEEGWTSVEAYREALQREGVPARERDKQIATFKERQELAKLKIIAGLLERSLGDLTKRDAEHQLREANKRSRALRRWLALTSVLMVAALAAGLFAWTRQQAAEKAELEAIRQKDAAIANEQRANEERDRATKARREAEKILNFLVYELRDELKALGKLSIAEEVQKTVQYYYDNLEINEGEIEQVRSRAAAHNNEGDRLLQQGDIEQAAESYEKGAALTRKLVEEDPSNRLLQGDLALSYVRAGNIKQRKGELGDALDLYRQALEIRSREAKLDPSALRWQIDVSSVRRDIATLYVEQGDLDAALKELQASLEIVRGLAMTYDSTPSWQSERVSVLGQIAGVYRSKGNLSEAFEAIEEAVQARRGLVGQTPQDADQKSDLILLLGQMGDVLIAREELPRAKLVFEEALALADGLCALDPSNSEWRYDSAVMRRRLAKVGVNLGDPDAAVMLLREAIARNRSSIAANPADVLSISDLAIALSDLGDILRAQDRDGALAAYEEAQKLGLELFRLSAPEPLAENILGVVEQRLADEYKARGHQEQAMEMYLRNLERSRTGAARDPSNISQLINLRMALDRVARSYADIGQLTRAIEAYEEELQVCRKVAELQPGDSASQMKVADALAQIALLRGGQLDMEAGLPLLMESREIIETLIQRYGETPESASALDKVRKWIQMFEEVPPLPKKP